MARVLVLNADYTPLRVVPWQRAVCMLLEEKVRLVTAYGGQVIRSPQLAMPHPAVVALVRYSRFGARIRLNRRNVLARDAFTCQYCGARPRKAGGKPDLAELTIDHVVPRARAKQGRVRLPDGRHVSVTCWQNVVTACVGCNHRKADGSPQQAGMRLLIEPRKPNRWDVLWMAATAVDLPEEWRDHLPAQSPWREYWTAELEED